MQRDCGGRSESMNGWMILWKYVFIVGVIAFAGMSLWVTIAGVGDIKRMFADLKSGKDDDA